MDHGNISPYSSHPFIPSTAISETKSPETSPHQSSEKKEDAESTVTSNSSLLEQQASTHLHQNLISKRLQQETKVSSSLIQLDKSEESGKLFHEAIKDARNAGRQEDIDKGVHLTKNARWFGASVYVYPPEEYKEMKMFLSPTKSHGVAVKDSGDIVSVFKNQKTAPRGVLEDLLPEALKNGGTHLDCFNGFLPTAYAKHHFVPVARVQFARDQAPSEWNYERDGKPDIIFMAYDPTTNYPTDDAERKKQVEGEISKLPYSAYEEALELQKLAVEKFKEGHQ